MNYKSQILLLLFLIFCIVGKADAHKVNIYAYAEDGMIFSESYFSDGTKCKNSLVEVFDGKTGVRLLEGKTDEDGKFSFKIPGARSLKLVLDAGMGHRDEYTLSEDEIKEAISDKQPLGQGKSSQPTSVKTKSLEAKGVASVGKGINESEIEAMIERVMGRKLKPVMRILVKLQEDSNKPGLTEIIGGIGYIVGLMGVAMYIKNRRKAGERQ